MEQFFGALPKIKLLSSRNVLGNILSIMFRPADLGDIRQRMAGWPGLLQDVQVSPDLCPGLLQLHAGGTGP